jgi:hypothetical protein
MNLFSRVETSKGIESHRVGLPVLQGVISTRLDAVRCSLHQKKILGTVTPIPISAIASRYG